MRIIRKSRLSRTDISSKFVVGCPWCIKVRFSSPESMMENLPFSCGWGWDVSLSLEGAAGAILQRISFELWNSLDCVIGSCGEFSFKYRSMALCRSFKGFQPISICSFLWPQRRTLHSGPSQVLAVLFVSRIYIFQDGGIGTSTSFGGRSFIHCFVEPTYVYSQRQS